jgi:glycosyltransferase involved in cell wall biosynthesis
VVCSLEPWDEIWRRNQFFTDALLKRNPELRVLFVEPAADPVFDLWSRRRPALPRLRTVSKDGRLRAFRPLKPVPRRLGSIADRGLLAQVRLVARTIGFSRPTLWINDVTYAPLIERTGWPSLYDVTDDWLLAPFPPREIERLLRLDALALAGANQVVVCSPSLVASRGAERAVTLIPNGVDVEHFRRPQPRPADLPPEPTAVYVGTLHEARLDVELVAETAHDLPHLQVVLVGPDALAAKSQALLSTQPNVHVLGPRPYEDVPGYLQHADVVIVPHVVTPFTESLDPIKAYECRAIDTPTVATPVGGFRDLHSPIWVVEPRLFTRRVRDLLVEGERPHERGPLEEISWSRRANAFEATLAAAR